MWTYNNTDELYHYGVLGMKWGHRKNIKDSYKERKAARKEYKKKFKSNLKKINKNSSFGEKILYSKGTRKQAAKYMTKNNMTMKEAKSKAKKELGETQL